MELAQDWAENTPMATYYKYNIRELCWFIFGLISGRILRGNTVYLIKCILNTDFLSGVTVYLEVQISYYNGGLSYDGLPW